MPDASDRSDTVGNGNRALYQYAPLSGAVTIRVLDLVNNKSSLKCCLSEIPIAEGGYQALSYEWGSSETPFHMTVTSEDGDDKGIIPLTANLEHALRNLRDCPTMTSRRFWIDQISINQGDEAEKGRQVGLMTQIYRSASRVITYLGPESGEKEESGALDLLAQLHRHFRLNYEYFENSTALDHLILEQSTLPVQGLPDGITSGHGSWPALLRIVCSGWLQRLWMVQENIVCPTAVMLRGPVEVDWLSVAFIPILFSLGLLPESLFYEQWPEKGATFTPTAVVNSMFLTWTFRLRYAQGSDTNAVQLSSLVENLDFYEELSCRDPRDRIFALLGISCDADELGIKPDYGRPVDDLFLNVSRSIQTARKDLFLLDMVSGRVPGPASSLPSWSFSSKRKDESVLAPFNPHPSIQTEVRFEDEGRTMVARGRVLDSVKLVGLCLPYLRFKPSADDRIREHKTDLLNIATLLTSVDCTIYTCNAFLHSLSASTTWPATVDYPSGPFTIYSFIRCRLMLLHDWTAGSITSDTVFVDAMTEGLRALAPLVLDVGHTVHEDIWADLAETEEEYGHEVLRRAVAQGRAMCVTHGNRICNTTGQVRQGDLIALLEGGCVAYILRAVGNAFRYEGDAHVHGVMDGEAYAGVDADEVDCEIRLV